VDRVSAHTRSRIMASVPARNTSPELVVRSYLHRHGLRFRVNDRRLPGVPDIVLPRFRTVVWVHGCFWHRHSHCRKATMPKSNVAFWRAKFRSNVTRDKRSRAQLTRIGWRVLVIWQCETKDAEALARLDQRIRG
jgi:DNA mismatch endonuclease (patch repair protein)